MLRVPSSWLFLLAPLACAGITEGEGTDDPAASGGAVSDGSGGIGSSCGGSGSEPGTSTGGAICYPTGGGPSEGWPCAHSPSSVTSPSECRSIGGSGGAIAIYCETVLVHLDPPITEQDGQLEISTNLDVELGLTTEYYVSCGDAEACARVQPDLATIETVALSWSFGDAITPQYGGEFPQEVTLALRNPTSDELIVSRTVALEYSCRGGDKWCWVAPPVTVDLSGTSLGGSNP